MRKLLSLPEFKFSPINTSAEAFVKALLISCLKEFFPALKAVDSLGSAFHTVTVRFERPFALTSQILL